MVYETAFTISINKWFVFCFVGMFISGLSVLHRGCSVEVLMCSFWLSSEAIVRKKPNNPVVVGSFSIVPNSAIYQKRKIGDKFGNFHVISVGQ